MGVLLGDTDLDNLPEQIDLETLAKDILGFEELNESQNQEY